MPYNFQKFHTRFHIIPNNPFFILIPILPLPHSVSVLLVLFTSLLFRLHIQTISYRFVFLWLISLSIMPSKPSMLVQMGIFHSFLWVSSIPLCACTCVCVCIYIYSVCVFIYTHHVFFIHSSVDGYSGCFHTLAIENTAAVTIGGHESFWISPFLSFQWNC